MKISIFLLFAFVVSILNAQISEVAFLNPPLDAKPSTYWMWMNGNITKKGLTADLEYMKRTGYGQAMMFNVGVGIPEGKVKYGSQKWKDMTLHACQEASRLGLELFIHNSPGYSGVGGPWIKPEYSMQQLVWTEVIVNSDGNGVYRIKLPKPITKENYYEDIAVIAYKTPGNSINLFQDLIKSVKVNKALVDNEIFFDNRLKTKVRLETAMSEIVFELSEDFEARSIMIFRDREIPTDPHDGPRDYPASFILQASSDGIHFVDVATISCPALRAMDAPGVATFGAVKAKFFKLKTNRPNWISEVKINSEPKINNFPAKLNFTKENVKLTRKTQHVDQEYIINSHESLNISHLINKKGVLKWKIPHGSWTIVRIGHTSTAEEMAAAPNSGKGLDCDKFSKSGVDKHFDLFLDPLLNKLKPYCGSTLKAILIDSWEQGKQNWTKELPAFFETKRGYKIDPFLLALTGRIVNSIEDTERFLWDFRRTNSDMFNENFLDRFKERAARHNLKFVAEPYGDGNFESLEYAEKLDYPMSEFWTRYIYGSEMTTKLVASSAHTNGKKIIMAESFTGTPFNSKFTEHPYAMKAQGDWMMTLGVNKFCYHVYAHQPYVGSSHGVMMTMGPFGTHLNRNSTWAEYAKEWNMYNARCAAMLQQGLYVADICILKDEAISNGIPDYDFIQPVVPEGYRWDIIDKNVLINRVSIKDDLILLPDGMNYKLLVMPNINQCSPEVLRQIIHLVDKGMNLLIVGDLVNGYMGYNFQKDKEVRRLAKILWTSTKIGKGKIFLNKQLQEVLNELNIKPDFYFTAENTDAQIHFIHRFIDGEHLYFISNHQRRSERITATFRVENMIPELWCPESGAIEKNIPYSSKNGVTKVRLNLSESGSVFVVFRNAGVGRAQIKDFPIISAEKYKNVTNNFSVSLWAKPETFSHPGRGFLLYPAEGEKIFGKGHAALGVRLGQNGVSIYERTTGSPKPVLVSNQQIEGWTHVTVSYQNGVPELFLNGKSVAVGQKSNFNIHPSLEQTAKNEQYVASFEGDQTPVQLFERGLSSSEILELYDLGIPAPTSYCKNSHYIMQLNDHWNVSFPEWSNVNDTIQLTTLSSLHKHSDFDVKHFSGTAVYELKFDCNQCINDFSSAIFLDLGRVENIAEVFLNGTYLGLVWKAPYKIKVPKQLIQESNHLKIKVTNLWPNRKIGDAYFPDLYPYDNYGRIIKFPTWFNNNTARPQNNKVIFSPWKHYTKEDPLLESGLLGPVLLIGEKAN